MLIQEFAYAFRLDYIIDRCGVISGPLQFGKEDQGYFDLKSGAFEQNDGWGVVVVVGGRKNTA